MVMSKLHHYCTNNQKTGDPEWKLMLSALESMVDSQLQSSMVEPVNLLHLRLPQSCTGMGIIPSVSQFLANIHASS